MVTQAIWRAYADLIRASQALDRSPYVHIKHPILVHGRAFEDGEMCPGERCNSRVAWITRRVEHIKVIINIQSGKRMFRKLWSAKRFDRIPKSATELWLPWLPFVITEDQYNRRCIKRRKLRKIIGAFGGNHSGKSQIGANLIVDLILFDGGSGGRVLVGLENRRTSHIASIGGESRGWYSGEVR